MSILGAIFRTSPEKRIKTDLQLALKNGRIEIRYKEHFKDVMGKIKEINPKFYDRIKEYFDNYETSLLATLVSDRKYYKDAGKIFEKNKGKKGDDPKLREEIDKVVDKAIAIEQNCARKLYQLERFLTKLKGITKDQRLKPLISQLLVILEHARSLEETRVQTSKDMLAAQRRVEVDMAEKLRDYHKAVESIKV